MNGVQTNQCYFQHVQKYVNFVGMSDNTFPNLNCPYIFDGMSAVSNSMLCLESFGPNPECMDSLTQRSVTRYRSQPKALRQILKPAAEKRPTTGTGTWSITICRPTFSWYTCYSCLLILFQLSNKNRRTERECKFNQNLIFFHALYFVLWNKYESLFLLINRNRKPDLAKSAYPFLSGVHNHLHSVCSRKHCCGRCDAVA